MGFERGAYTKHTPQHMPHPATAHAYAAHNSTRDNTPPQQRTRVDQQPRAAPRADHRQLRETDVVADADADPPRRSVDDRRRPAGRERVRLLERHLAGDVDVKKVHLSVLCQQRAVGAEDAARVEQLAAAGALGDGAADQRHARRGGRLGERRERGRAARGGGVEILCIDREAVVRVGAVPHFRQHHECRARRGRLGDGGARGGDVGGLVGGAAQLAERDLDLLGCCRRRLL